MTDQTSTGDAGAQASSPMDQLQADYMAETSGGISFADWLGQKTPPFTRTVAEAFIRSQGRVCRGPLSDAGAEKKQAHLDAGELEEASAVDAAHRPGCGADFNDIVVAGPYDGQSHEYACPRCKVTGTYVAPLIPIAEE